MYNLTSFFLVTDGKLTMLNVYFVVVKFTNFLKDEDKIHQINLLAIKFGN